MNFDKISSFAITVVIIAAMSGNLDRLNHWVQVATAKVLWESRASTWGSPHFWSEQDIDKQQKFHLGPRTLREHRRQNPDMPLSTCRSFQQKFYFCLTRLVETPSDEILTLKIKKALSFPESNKAQRREEGFYLYFFLSSEYSFIMDCFDKQRLASKIFSNSLSISILYIFESIRSAFIGGMLIPRSQLEMN